MNPQIAALHALQSHDRKMVALEAKLKAIPRRLEEMNNDVAGVEAMVERERAKVQDTIAFREEQEVRLEDEEEQIRNSKTRLGTVKTTRELNAAQREIDTTRRLATTRAQEIDNINAAIKAAEERLETMEKSLAELKTQVDAEIAKLEAEKAKVEAAMASDSGARAQLSKQVERDILRTYERIRRRSGGVAFVPVRERRCGACRMTVPHSQYVELRHGNSVEPCESCGRLMYWQGHFPEEKARVDAKLRKKAMQTDEEKFSETV